MRKASMQTGGVPTFPRAAVIGMAGCVLVFLVLLLLLDAGVATPLDTAGDAALAPLRTHAVLAVFLWITAMGVEPARAALLLTASALLWGMRRRVLPLWVATLGSEATTWIAKFVIARPRPAFLPGVATAHSPSFPSAHAAGTMALVGILAVLLARARPERRGVVAVLAGLAIVLVAFSRLVLNVHYPTDVASGLAVGGFWVFAGSMVGRREAPSGPGPTLTVP